MESCLRMVGSDNQVVIAQDEDNLSYMVKKAKARLKINLNKTEYLTATKYRKRSPKHG